MKTAQSTDAKDEIYESALPTDDEKETSENSQSTDSKKETSKRARSTTTQEPSKRAKGNTANAIQQDNIWIVISHFGGQQEILKIFGTREQADTFVKLSDQSPLIIFGWYFDRESLDENEKIFVMIFKFTYQDEYSILDICKDNEISSHEDRILDRVDERLAKWIKDKEYIDCPHNDYQYNDYSDDSDDEIYNRKTTPTELFYSYDQYTWINCCIE